MQQVERHIRYEDAKLTDLCFKSARLYNFVTYHYRQSIFGKQAYFSEFEMSKLCTEFNQEDYRALPAQTAQQVIKQVFTNFKSFFEAKKTYDKSKAGFSGKPKLPKYKDKSGLNIAVFTNQQVKVKGGYIHFPKMTGIAPLKTKVDNLAQVRIIPQATCFVIEVVYEKKETDSGLEKDNVLSIDLGLNNLIATSNNVGLAPFIINGKILKSFNHWYNKSKAKLMAYVGGNGASKRLCNLNNYRNNYIHDKMHKASRFIIDYCIENNIGTIVIGRNKGWKNSINLGKKTNQKFVELPHLKLIEQIAYKGKLVGIKVVETEEAYTSKCDHLALENMSKQEAYLGKRKKRGLFQSSVGKLLNADTNGSIGIARKVFGNSIVSSITNSGFVYNPYSINII